ncbi:MAG: DUF2752 domain-containing protein [Deltaproteobacteria bacterium]
MSTYPTAMSSSSTGKGRTEHLWILAMAVAAIAGSFLLVPSGGRTLDLTVPFTGIQIPLPATCLSYRIFGVSCPGCGLTKSFVLTARGNLGGALRANPVGPALYVVCLLQIPYRWIEYFGLGRSITWWKRVDARLDVVTWVLLGGLVLQWLVNFM